MSDDFDEELEKLFAQLKSPVKNDRWLAVAGLRQAIFDDRVIDTLIAVLKNTDEDPEIRALVAISFDAVREEQVTLLLIETLKDKNPDVRASAAWSLGEIGDRRALPALEWIEQNDTDELENGFPVSAAAEEALAGIRAATD